MALLFANDANASAPSCGFDHCGGVQHRSCGTPLHHATRLGLTHVVLVLLKAGADPQAMSDNQTAIQLAQYRLTRGVVCTADRRHSTIHFLPPRGHGSYKCSARYYSLRGSVLHGVHREVGFLCDYNLTEIQNRQKYAHIGMGRKIFTRSHIVRDRLAPIQNVLQGVPKVLFHHTNYTIGGKWTVRGLS